jgi:hypothetical protein
MVAGALSYPPPIVNAGIKATILAKQAEIGPWQSGWLFSNFNVTRA